MVFVKDLLRLLDVDLFTRARCPWQHGQPLNVVAREGVVGRGLVHSLQAAKLLQRILLRLLRHTRGFDLLAQLGNVFVGVVCVAQLFANGLLLLAQVVLPLRLLHRILHLALDLVAKLLHLKLFRKMLIEPLQTAQDVRRLKQVLLFHCRQKRQRRGHEIRQTARFFDVERDRLQVVRECRRTRNDRLKLRDHIALQGLGFRRERRLNLEDGFVLRSQKGRGLVEVTQMYPLRALSKDEKALIWHLDDLVNRRKGADNMQVTCFRNILACVPLSHDQNRLGLA